MAWRPSISLIIRKLFVLAVFLFTIETIYIPHFNSIEYVFIIYIGMLVTSILAERLVKKHENWWKWIRIGFLYLLGAVLTLAVFLFANFGDDPSMLAFAFPYYLPVIVTVFFIFWTIDWIGQYVLLKYGVKRSE
ncbi:hypothetical protein [Desmospora profundinema]|uniref:Membrane protein n=1 Tax=Desmospora profundinema TaxID=1571184 RepID=A0ABU1ISQ0_9BACL|nr:hypothetical protein [Desmospora profundinema]MDR6226795.1 putative membrane protein [Desmospora profundinema]